MGNFSILPLDKFTGSGAAIRRPKVLWMSCWTRTFLMNFQEIACFSYDDDHTLHLDGRSLRYYHPPNLGADLSNGFDAFQKLDDTSDNHLDSLLRTIMELEQKAGIKCTADFVTWR